MAEPAQNPQEVEAKAEQPPARIRQRSLRSDIGGHHNYTKTRADKGVPRGHYNKPRSDIGVPRRPYKPRSDRGKRRKPINYNALLQDIPTEIIQAEIAKRSGATAPAEPAQP